jgi:hypothetical protein
MGNDQNNGTNAPTPDPVPDPVLAEAGATALALHRTPGGAVTSADLTTAEGKRVYYQMRMGVALKAEEFINTEISVKHITITPAHQINPDTGELERWARCVVMLADGRLISFGSLGIIKSLSLYIDCEGPPPWDPPAKFILRSTPIGKNRWYELYAPALGEPTPPRGRR